MSASQLDITYCTSEGCPFKECERHQTKLKQVARKFPGRMVSMADLSGTCPDYIGWLIKEEMT